MFNLNIKLYENEKNYDEFEVSFKKINFSFNDKKNFLEMIHSEEFLKSNFVETIELLRKYNLNLCCHGYFFRFIESIRKEVNTFSYKIVCTYF